MSAPTFNHVSVTCADLDRSLAFYNGLLELPVVDSGEDSSEPLRQVIALGDVRLRFATLDLGGGSLLELLEYVQPSGTATRSRTCDPGNVHLALTVPDIAATHRRLTEAGVETRSGPVTFQDGDWRGTQAFYSLDPDGVTVELIQLAPR